MMATLDIGQAVDEHGMEVAPEVEFDNAVFRCVCGCPVGKQC